MIAGKNWDHVKPKHVECMGDISLKDMHTHYGTACMNIGHHLNACNNTLLAHIQVDGYSTKINSIDLESFPN